MRLRAKFFTFVIPMILCVIAINSFVGNTFLIGEYEHLEGRQAVDDVDRASNALDNSALELVTKLADWSAWDDTYGFIDDKNQAYIESNLQSGSLSSLGVNIMMFLDTNGAVVFGKNINLDTEKDENIPEELIRIISENKQLRAQAGVEDSQKGLLVIGGRPFLMAARPITTSARLGPIKGTLIFGKYISSDLIAYLNKLTKIKFSTEIYESSDLPPNYKKAKKELGSSKYFNEVVSRNELDSYGLYKDIFGKNALILKIDSNRDIFNQGERNITFFLAYIVLAAIITIIVLYFVVNSVFLKKILILSRDVTEYINNPHNQKIIKIVGKDEFSNLAENINLMIGKLQNVNRVIEEKGNELAAAVAEKDMHNAKLQETQGTMIKLLSDSKAMEQKYQSEKNLMQSIVNSMGESLLVINSELKIVAINKAAEKLLEVAPDFAVGKKWSDIVTVYVGDQQINFEERNVLKSFKTGVTTVTTIEDNHYYQTVTGKRFLIESTTTPLITNNQVIGVVKVFRDITHEKEQFEVIEQKVDERTAELRAEKQKLKDSETRLFRFLDTIPEGILVRDSEGKSLYANHEIANLLANDYKIDPSLDLDGFLKKYSIYKAGTNDIYPLEQYTAYRILRGEILDDKAVSLRDVEIRRADKTIPIEVTTKAIRSGTKDLEYIISVYHDLTEEKIIERSKDEFFSIASHELRTPLSAIRGNASMILDYFKESIRNKDLHEMIDDIHESSIRLINIVNDFLDLSRLEQGKITFTKSYFSISQIIDKVCEETKSIALSKDLYVTCESPTSNLPMVYADPSRVIQVLTNLIGNSLKYTDRGGVTIKVNVLDNDIEIEVIDTGRGISVQNQGLLFRKFQQASSSILTRDTVKSTGLGLFISKLLVEKMGGRIYLKSSIENQGSVFAFTLPLHAKPDNSTSSVN